MKLSRQYITEAIGPRHGDFIEIANAWARVQITRETEGNSTVFIVTGDGPLLVFPQLSYALECAYTRLADYQLGRAD